MFRAMEERTPVTVIRGRPRRSLAPMAFRKFARSTTSGSHAALMMVTPGQHRRHHHSRCRAPWDLSGHRRIPRRRVCARKRKRSLR
jgi:hypothetical protein